MEGRLSRRCPALILVLIAFSVFLMSCASRAKRAVLDGVGPATILLEPDRAPIPLIKVAKALGWAPRVTPNRPSS